MQTRIIGIDLAVTATHKAIVLDQTSNRFESKLLKFRTDPAAMERGIIKSCGLARVSKVAYPWGDHIPTAAQSRRKDTPWTRVPQMTSKDKFPRLSDRWTNWPEKGHDA